jgi:L,D-transpeptidase catalytic domain
MLACAAPVCGAAHAATAGHGGPVGTVAANPPGQTRLSDERELSRWAYPVSAALVHAAPAGASRVVARLRLQTEEGFPQPYLLLSSYVDTAHNTWVRLRVPGRPNGRTGWVLRDALSPFHVVRTYLRVNRRTLRAVLYRTGRRIWSARVGVGKASTPTPAGRFWVRERFRVRDAPFYGPYAIGTSAYAPKLSEWPHGGVVGLHGTSEPQLIPGRPSHGCIRLRNADIARLWRLLPLGTPVRIV